MAGTPIHTLSRLLLLAAVTIGVALVPRAVAAATPARTIAPPTRIPDPLPMAPAGAPVSTSTMPEALRRAVVADAATRFKVSPNDVVLTRAEQVTWPDGALGCPRPGRTYTQMQVPGFRVLAKTVAGEMLYHTDAHVRAVTCANMLGPRSLEKSAKPVETVTQPPVPSNPSN